MKTVIFGGSFNPPTKGHEGIARACLENIDCDELWLMPSGDRLDKQQSIDDLHRMRMLGLMAQRLGDERVSISRFELGLPRPHKTIRTLGALASAYPGMETVFIYGADSYWNMSTWEGGEHIQKQLQLIIVPRAGYALPHSKNVIILPVPSNLIGISSSDVREKVISQEPITGLVDSLVEAYISGNQLYKSKIYSVGKPKQHIQ